MPTRLLITDCDASGLAAMNQHIELAAKLLATCNPDLIVYVCTSGSFMGGEEGEQAIRDRLTRLTTKPVMTTSQAVLTAMKHLDLKRIVMLTPYDEDLTQREVGWLGANGVEVIDFHFRDLPGKIDRGARVPEKIFHLARRLNWPEVNGIFFNAPTFGPLISSISWNNTRANQSSPAVRPLRGSLCA